MFVTVCDPPIAVQTTQRLAQDLMDCLLTAEGLNCALVTEMISTTQDTSEQYIGVLPRLSTDDQSADITVKKNVERFAWEFLANRTRVGDPTTACDPYTVSTDKRLTCATDEVCVY